MSQSKVNQQEWQPISTAPKDGTCVLLWLPTLKEYTVGLWATAEGWYGTSPYAGGVLGKHQPTHWQSLPDPPKE